jgi:probable rRNA maturation factor
MDKVKIKVNISDRQKAVKLPVGTRMLLRRSCIAVLSLEKFPFGAEVNITIVDAPTIREMNRIHRDTDLVTDVLSFPMGENGEYDTNPETGLKMLGDIVICAERAREQAKEFDHRLQREFAYLTAHSMLHLLGYDHVSGGLEKVRMREKEEAVMELLGTTRDEPYEEEE